VPARAELRARESIVKVHLKPRLGHVPLAKLAPATVTDYFAELDMRGAPHVFKVLRAALNHAVRMDLILANPCDRVRPPRPAEFRPTLWTVEETIGFLAEVRNTRAGLYPLFLTEVTTGLRLGEILALTWRNIDLEARAMRMSGPARGEAAAVILRWRLSNQSLINTGWCNEQSANGARGESGRRDCV
jgi:integrase